MATATDSTQKRQTKVKQPLVAKVMGLVWACSSDHPIFYLVIPFKHNTSVCKSLLTMLTLFLTLSPVCWFYPELRLSFRLVYFTKELIFQQLGKKMYPKYQGFANRNDYITQALLELHRGGPSSKRARVGDASNRPSIHAARMPDDVRTKNNHREQRLLFISLSQDLRKFSSVSESGDFWVQSNRLSRPVSARMQLDRIRDEHIV